MPHTWIVGASTGIGAALAVHLARAGHTVAVSARSAERLETLARESPVPGAIFPVPIDVRERASVEAAAASVFSRLSKLDYCFLNAGKYELSRDLIDPSVYEEVTRVNYLGVVECLAVVLPRMIQAGSGQVLITSSIAGYRGLPKAGAYGPTKAALISLAETLAVELKPAGVRVRVINPGFVRTPLTAKNRFPMPFLLEADEAACRIVRALPRRSFEIAFPWPMVMGMKLLRILPNRAYLSWVGKMVR
jgi:NAD(P)-dependent dehydrogenase (short-subunit alcohol dehydrogenase family)